MLGVQTFGRIGSGAPREAVLYEQRPDGSVVCALCAHRCVIRPGRAGICAVRENRGGRLVTLVADRVVAENIDPIEKKPFFHFLPGSSSYSIATAGCNFHCQFCQNWDISQWPHTLHGRPPGVKTSAAEIVEAAKLSGCESIAYTYTEPTIFFELALDTCRLAAASGLKNVFVTNGYMTPEALDMIAPVLHGANVDLKSFSDRFYRRICGARREPVLDTIVAMRRHGIWVEVTTLLVPGENDSDRELAEMADWLSCVDRDMPWHLSAFFPAHKMLDVPPTPLATLQRAAEIGRAAGLRYVYTGNVHNGAQEATTCWRCASPVVQRHGFAVVRNQLAGGRCPKCDATIAGLWS